MSSLPLERRLALAYAPARARGQTLALFALDARLAAVVRQAREPILAQMRLAWWRERLTDPDGPALRAEPVLELADLWGTHRPGLAALVDGWENLLGEAPLPQQNLAAFASARGAACRGLAEALGLADEAEKAGRAGEQWALAELAQRLSHLAEIAAVRKLIAGRDWHPIKLNRALRPLQVLQGLARRSRGQGELLSGPASALAAIRLGLLGI